MVGGELSLDQLSRKVRQRIYSLLKDSALERGERGVLGVVPHQLNERESGTKLLRLLRLLPQAERGLDPV